MDTDQKVRAETHKKTAKSRILVVDDHPLVAEGLADLINRQQDVICCGTANDVLEAEKEVAHQKPDLVLLDLRLGNGDGLELIKVLKSRFSELRILVLSQMEETLYAERVLRAGAHGYVMKEQATEEVLRAIRMVVQGRVYVSQKISLMALMRVVEEKPQRAGPDLSFLTDRELHVLKSISAGKSTRQIAAELNLSIKTIETYREHLKYKLGLANGAQLIEFAEKLNQKAGEVIALEERNLPMRPAAPLPR